MALGCGSGASRGVNLFQFGTLFGERVQRRRNTRFVFHFSRIRHLDKIPISKHAACASR
jgi:hypothetical protein